MSPRQHRRISRDVARVLLNVRKFFESERDNKARFGLARPVDRVVAATGVSRKTISKIQTENNLDSFPDDEDGNEKRKRPKIPHEDHAERVREALTKIRKVDKEESTLDAIFKVLGEQCGEDGDRWRWSRATLHRFMTEKGFSFIDCPNHYDKAKRNPAVLAMRADYVKWIQKHRGEGKVIFYQDETWIFKNMQRSKTWSHESDGAQNAAPSGKGPRCIIAHVGSSATGLLPEALLMFRGSQAARGSDYHTEMNAQVFMDWLDRKVLPAIKKVSNSSVLVLDRASYHTPLTDFTKPPNKSMRKKLLIECIDKWGGPSEDWPLLWRSTKTNKEMFECADAIKPAPRYIAQEIASEYGVDILFLPVAHPELNPIEMLWSRVKRRCSKKKSRMQVGQN